MHLNLSREKMLPMAAMLGLGALAASLAWHDFRLATSLPSPVVAPPSTAGETPVQAPTLDASRASLTARALFGTAETTSDEAAKETAAANALPDAAALPTSTASYQLFGVIDSPRENERRAVVGTGETDQQELAVGSAAPDGATVRAIRQRLVVLDRNGALEKLELPRPSLDAGSISASALPLPTQVPWTPPAELLDDAYPGD